MQATLNCDPNKAHATAMLPLGFKHTLPARNRDGAKASDPQMDCGQIELVYVYNDSGADIDPGDVCLRAAGEPTWEVLTAPAALAPAMRTVGVALFEIPDGEFGFIAWKGIVPVKHETSNVANLSLVHGQVTAGCVEFMPVGAEENVFGLGLTNNAAAAGTLVDAYINCPGA